jgi:hypothetical protein
LAAASRSCSDGARSNDDGVERTRLGVGVTVQRENGALESLLIAMVVPFVRLVNGPDALGKT